MIKNLDISGVHLEVGDDLHKYVVRKIGRLSRFVPRQMREDIQVAVKLKEGKAADGKDRTCEVIMKLPNETLVVNETTVNIFAAVDIAEAKLKARLRKYKETQVAPRFHQRIAAKLRRA